MIDVDGAWRDDLWLEQYLPAAPSEDDSGGPSPPVLTAPLPINTCSTDSLKLLPRVGPVLAGRIDQCRREGLVFGSTADLQRVKGIGPVLAARLETLVVFHRATAVKNGPPSISP